MTETTTEYREVNDDSDFGNFGSSSGSASGFPSLGSDDKWKEVKKLESGRKTVSSSSRSQCYKMASTFECYISFSQKACSFDPLKVLYYSLV